jgi:hypothetical protein
MQHQQDGRSEAQLSGVLPTRFGQSRPAPAFAPESVAANQLKLQDDVAAQDLAEHSPQSLDAGARNPMQQELQVDEKVTPLPHPRRQDFTLSVEEILIRLHEVGIEKSKDSVQRYCREGALECQKLGLFKRYFATEKSLGALIEKMQPDEDARACIQVQEAAPIRDGTKNNNTDAGASNRTQEHAPLENLDENKKPAPETTGGENLVEFLKEEIRVKNKQLEVKDTQIAAMLDRDRETNILIKGLQNHLGDTFAMLTGKAGREADGRAEYQGTDQPGTQDYNAD